MDEIIGEVGLRRFGVQYIAMRMHEMTTRRGPILPGEILAEELTKIDMSAAELGRMLNVPTNRITRIVSGKRAITADSALRLGQWLGTRPEFWLNLQKSYEPPLAEQESGVEILRTIVPRAG